MEHNLVVLENGLVISYGGNSFGELGLGYTSVQELLPKQIININNAIYTSCGN